MSFLSPRRKRQLLSGFLGVILVSSVLGATLVVGAERTAMDAETVRDSFAKAGVSAALSEQMREEFQQDGGETAGVGVGGTDAPTVDQVAESVVTTDYVRGEVNASVDALYAYLHGERETLSIAIDLTPVRDGFAAEYEQWVRDAPVADLEPDWDGEGLDYSMAALAANESSFQATRESFREDQLQRIQDETPRERSRDELEQLYDDYREQIRDEMVSRLESAVAQQDAPEPLQQPVVDYMTVGVDALVAEETSSDQFLQEEAAAREALATAVGDVVRTRLAEEVPASMNLTGEMDAETRQGLEMARTGVSIANLLVSVLPVVALLAAGLLVVVSRRRSNALWRIGGAVAVAGVLGVAGAKAYSVLLSGLLDGENGDLPAVGRAMLDVVETTVGAITAQSLVLVVLGVALVVAGIAVRRDMVPIDDDPGETAES